MSKRDYLNSIKGNTDKRIEELNKMITSIDEILNDYTIRRQTCQDEITKLTADNTIVDEIIKDVPVSAGTIK